MSHFEYVPGAIGEGAAVGGISEAVSNKLVRVTLPEGAEVLLPSTRHFDVSSAGQLPSGFDPGAFYPSRNHPRALQMTVFAMSDALADLGMAWHVLADAVPAEAISVYVSGAMGQLDEAGYGGMLRSRALGRRVTLEAMPVWLCRDAGRLH